MTSIKFDAKNRSVWRLGVATCRYLLEVTMGTHCIKRLLQQPEHRCTSTQGGHNMKFALRRSSRDRFTSITSVRTLQTACWAGCASTENGGGGEEALLRRSSAKGVKREGKQRRNLLRLRAYRPWLWSARVSCSSSSSAAKEEVGCSVRGKETEKERQDFINLSLRCLILSANWASTSASDKRNLWSVWGFLGGNF